MGESTFQFEKAFIETINVLNNFSLICNRSTKKNVTTKIAIAFIPWESANSQDLDSSCILLGIAWF